MRILTIEILIFKITISLKEAPVLAYLFINEKHDLVGIERSINSLLTNNHFTMTENPDATMLFIDMSTKMEAGSIVTGGTYDLKTWYCSLVLKVYNNKTEELLLNYAVEQVKVLVPVHKTEKEATATCIREVMKRVNRELPTSFKKLNLN